MAGSDKITPAGEKLLKELKKLKKLQVRVGVQGGKLHTKKFPDGKEKLGADLVDIAIWNELGTDKIPARPFLGQTVDLHGGEIQQISAEMVQNICKGQLDAQSAFKKIGVVTVGYVQDQITNGEFEPNAPMTVQRKGSDQPLIDTGQLRRGISYVICKKGEYD